MVTIVTMYFYTILYGLILVNFEINWLKCGTFSIDANALNSNIVLYPIKLTLHCLAELISFCVCNSTKVCKCFLFIFSFPSHL